MDNSRIMHSSLSYHQSSASFLSLCVVLCLYLDVGALCLDELLVDVGPHGPHLVDLRVELTAAVADLRHRQNTMRRETRERITGMATLLCMTKVRYKHIYSISIYVYVPVPAVPFGIVVWSPPPWREGSRCTRCGPRRPPASPPTAC